LPASLVMLALVILTCVVLALGLFVVLVPSLTRQDAPVEEEPGLALPSAGPILERRPSRRRSPAVKPSPSINSRRVISFDQVNQARSEGNPRLGDGTGNRRAGQRSNPKGLGTAVHPGAQSPVASGAQ
jgi:hypothetical protein